MRKIDHDGFLLCKIQGSIFENSLKKTSTSSEIFIRRFMFSNIAKEFDSKAYLDSSITKDEVFELIDDEYGESSYGKNKYSGEVLYWIGYLYRYFSYTYELTSKQVYRYVKPKELNGLYLAYHSFDCTQAIERILEAKNISFDADEQNKRLLKIIKETRYNKEITMNSAFDDASFYSKSADILHEPQDLLTFDFKYKGKSVGQIDIKKVEETIGFKITIYGEYSKRGMEYTLLNKTLELVKTFNGVKKITTSVNKDEQAMIEALKNRDFVYKDEDRKNVYFEKKNK